MSFRSLAEALLSGRPYFGPALRAMQGVPERHQYFLAVVKAIVRDREAKTLDVLEIGSWAGASTVSWALALQAVGAAGTVTCVDPWAPYFGAADEDKSHYREMNHAARDGLITLLFNHNIRSAGVADLVRQHRDYSRNVLPDFPADQFDIVYIDGSHRFEDVCFDVHEAKRLLRGKGVICGDDLEILSRELQGEELTQAIAGGHDYVYSKSARSHYHPGVTAAVGREFLNVGMWGGFWAVRRQGDKWTVPDLDLSALRVPDHILHRQGQIRIVESTKTYNIVQDDGLYFALQKKLGPVELFQEQLGDRELPPLLLRGATLEEVRRKVELEKRSISEAEPDVTVLTGSHGEFNLVAYQGQIFALRKSLGPVNVADGEDVLRQRFGPEDFTVAADAPTARGMIDQIELIRKGEGATAELAVNIANLAAEIEKLRDAAAVDNGLRERECTELRELIGTNRQDVLAEPGFCARLETAVCEITARMKTLSGKQDLLSRQVTLMRYGPGSPETPCLAGEDFGFRFTHYRGLVYALRKPLDLDDLSRGVPELLALHGADDVIVGDTLDGVRARVQIGEGLREVRAGIAAVDLELLAVNRDMAERLSRVDSAVQAHTYNLEKLGRQWWNRVFNH